MVGEAGGAGDRGSAAAACGAAAEPQRCGGGRRGALRRRGCATLRGHSGSCGARRCAEGSGAPRPPPRSPARGGTACRRCLETAGPASERPPCPPRRGEGVPLQPHRAAGSPRLPELKIALARCPRHVPIINNARSPPREGFGWSPAPGGCRLVAPQAPGRTGSHARGGTPGGSWGSQPVALGRAGESRRLRDTRRSPPGWEGAGGLPGESVLVEIALPQWRTHGCGALPAARLLRPAAFRPRRGQRRGRGRGALGVPTAPLRRGSVGPGAAASSPPAPSGPHKLLRVISSRYAVP
ncbi:collagen alpha-1(III) chain-like [Passer domesticus]|uniref:collagen alpha-1(III) chain-like n=1 Tax=Passer domesticus TaxID=48849 RepID=UPI0030FE58B1